MSKNEKITIPSIAVTTENGRTSVRDRSATDARAIVTTATATEANDTGATRITAGTERGTKIVTAVGAIATKRGSDETGPIGTEAPSGAASTKPRRRPIETAKTSLATTTATAMVLKTIKDCR